MARIHRKLRYPRGGRRRRIARHWAQAGDSRGVSPWHVVLSRAPGSGEWTIKGSLRLRRRCRRRTCRKSWTRIRRARRTTQPNPKTPAMPTTTANWTPTTTASWKKGKNAGPAFARSWRRSPSSASPFWCRLSSKRSSCRPFTCRPARWKTPSGQTTASRSTEWRTPPTRFTGETSSSSSTPGTGFLPASINPRLGGAH